jgi:hypothetical protein
MEQCRPKWSDAVLEHVQTIKVETSGGTVDVWRQKDAPELWERLYRQEPALRSITQHYEDGSWIRYEKN